jgi:YbbR domain-containing protein
MEKNVLQSIAGITIYPLISFAIFFLFFAALLVYVLVANKQHLSSMSQLPLTSEDEDAALIAHPEHDVVC